MHVHILTKVWDLKRVDWDTHMGPHKGTAVVTKLCKGIGADVGSQVYMHTYTDACAHYNRPFA